MPVAALLDHAVMQPLMIIYDAIFRELVSLLPDVGLALIAFGVVINLLLAPIYFQMERSGRHAASANAPMAAEVARIKAHYRGRERYFYIRTIHRHYGHRPISAVLGSRDLFLQVLVFATVYRYLSGLPLLDGAEFFGIADLGKPDSLLFGLNVLPFFMTLANVLSAVVYVDDKGKRRQAFGMAALFLVLLYSSPSGLVLYWTSNNVFSLARNLAARELRNKLPPALLLRLSQFGGQS